MFADARIGPALILALVLLWAPLPFASVVVWADALLQVACLFLLVLVLKRPMDEAVWRRVRLPALALVVLAVLGLFQSMPIPRWLVALLAPGRAASVPGPTGLSFSPWFSLWTSLALASLAALLVASAGLGRSRPARRLVWTALFAVALFEVFYGARGWFARDSAIWGVQVPQDVTRLRGTFVNPNHLALLLEIALAGGFALVWWGLRRARREPRLESRLVWIGLPLLGWAVLLVGLAFTGSRGGLLALLAGTVVQGAVLVATSENRRPALVGLGLLALLGGGALAATSLSDALSRFFSGSLAASGGAGRLDVWRASLDLFGTSPILGIGLGAFREGFPRVQPGSLPGLWWHAHNDVLELLLNAGVVGLLVASVGGVSMARRLGEAFRNGRRSEDRAAALAALGAFAAVAVHELYDFGLTMPSNAAALVAVVGLALGAAQWEERSRGAGTTGTPDTEASVASSSR